MVRSLMHALKVSIPATLGLLLCTLLSMPHVARAQTDKAAAEVLFREGMRSSKAGDYAEACAKLEESQRLEASLGAQYYLADCYEHIGRSASAWANYVEVANKARAAKELGKEQAASKRAAALEPKLARMSIDVEDRALAGLEVRRGDIVVGPAQWGVAVPVDPGSYVLRASAPGHQAWSKTLDVADGVTLSERVPTLEPLPVELTTAAAPAPAPAPVEQPLPSAGLQPAPVAPAHPSHARRTAGIVVAAVGVVALGASAVFVVLAKNADADSKKPGACAADGVCSKQGLSDRNRALSFADSATVASIAGGVLTATGVVLWLTAPHAQTEVGLGPSSVTLRGRF